MARGNFSATYTLLSGSGECAQLKGEVLGIQAYNAQRSATDRSPNYDRTSIGIQPQSITDLLAGTSASPDPADKPYALGEFGGAEPGPDDFCVAPNLSVSRLRLSEVAEQTDACGTTPAQPAVDIAYVWTDVRVYTTAAALGTALSATLKYTKDGCTARYHVRAVYPSVSCNAAPPPEVAQADDASAEAGAADASAGLDAGDASVSDASAADAGGVSSDADASCPAPTPEPAAPIADSSLCSPFADLKQGRPTGSGLNPDLDIRCDPDLLLCVLRRDPPSLR